MSSSDTDDDFVKYGTPLEPLEEDEIPNKKPCLLEDQIVRDKHGRRRFHGAFTGGFSAGFFNSVGSLEGWKPSSFKSSKNEKQKIVDQKPEDYMDEEDVGEFGIAPVILQTKSDYRCHQKNSVHVKNSGSNLGAYVFHNLLKPIRETVGMKLLMRMGWKAGQGIGPRTKKNEKKNILKFRRKTYGCQPCPEFEEQEESDSDSEWADITYAPTDYEPYLFSSKNNFFGIGYQGLQKSMVLGSSNQTDYRRKLLTELENKKQNIVGQAFGVGAFEDEDEDIYAKDDPSQYDFSLPNDNCKQDERVKITPRTDSEEILEGFTRQLKKCMKSNHPLPVLPKDFNCRHNSPFSTCKKIDEGKRFSQEEGFCSVVKCDTLLEKEIKKFCEKKTESEIVPKQRTSNSVASNHYNFKPFCYDPVKQERFEKYVKLFHAGKKDELCHLQPFIMTEWDKEREKIEFDQAAKLLMPFSEVLENRFLPARQMEDLSDPLAVVEKFSDESEDCRNAAKMKMFGPLTRKIEEWIPSPLLSKRFNIPEVKKRCVEEKKVDKDFSSLFDPIGRTEKVNNEIPVKVSHAGLKMQMSEKNEEKNQSLKAQVENVKSKVDLYKEIFLASDSEDEKANFEKEEICFEEHTINVKRNTSPPRGIFENVELKVSKCNKFDAISEKKVNSSNEDSDVFDAGPNSDAVYGPKIPEKIEARVKHHFNKNLLDDSNWVEKNMCSKKHKKKSKKSKKSKSHKSSHKKK